MWVDGEEGVLSLGIGMGLFLMGVRIECNIKIASRAVWEGRNKRIGRYCVFHKLQKELTVQ